jgi:hypothetical protein
VERLKDQVRRLTRRTTGETLPVILERINRLVKGWGLLSVSGYAIGYGNCSENAGNAPRPVIENWWRGAFHQLLRQPDRRRFLWRRYGWLIFLGSLPYPLLRVARLAYAIVVYRRLRRSDYVAMGRVVIARRAQSTLLFAVLAALIVLEVSSLLILGAESASPDRNIKAAFDAVWWNIVTMGTVGYGDSYPVTTLGRIIGIVVIITGAGLFSGITSFLAQWFLKPRVADDAAAGKVVAAQVQALATSWRSGIGNIGIRWKN